MKSWKKDQQKKSNEIKQHHLLLHWRLLYSHQILDDATNTQPFCTDADTCKKIRIKQRTRVRFPFFFTQPNAATCDLLHPKFSDPFQADKNTKTSIGAISHSSHFEQQVGK
jgi:hypothetical protein